MALGPSGVVSGKSLDFSSFDAFIPPIPSPIISGGGGIFLVRSALGPVGGESGSLGYREAEDGPVIRLADRETKEAGPVGALGGGLDLARPPA